MATKIDVNSSRYKDALEHTSAYNARLGFERKQRTPFLDAQTGVAQVGCHLWKSKLVRRAPAYPYQLYSYPGRRWKKKPRKVVQEQEAVPTVEQPVAVVESSLTCQAVSTPDASTNLEEKPEPSEVGTGEGSAENTDDDSESEEELALGARKPGRPGRPGRPPKVRIIPPHMPGFPNFKLSKVDPSTLKVRNYTKEELAKMNYDERQKPYVCEICGKRYKNGPGLKYHYTHYNHDQDGSASETAEMNPAIIQQTLSEAPGSPIDPAPQFIAKPVFEATEKEEPDSAVITPNDYCDFCLGDINKNKKTLMSEELVSCADCGRSGHPTCLQFTLKLTYNVKKYRWQCIECKSCTLCGTSDNDDQLLFCDDCDRGYHMYCLKPPMDTPPEGSWICKLCDEES